MLLVGFFMEQQRLDQIIFSFSHTQPVNTCGVDVEPRLDRVGRSFIFATLLIPLLPSRHPTPTTTTGQRNLRAYYSGHFTHTKFYFFID